MISMVLAMGQRTLLLLRKHQDRFEVGTDWDQIAVNRSYLAGQNLLSR
jgi:hypothetical protein